MRYDAVLFDLDGTLLNTLGDLRNAVNHALSLFDLPPRSLEEVRAFIGNGVANLIRRAMPEDAADGERDKALAAFRERYNAHLDEQTAPYPGIPDLLCALREAKVRVCVNSNKYDAALQTLCKSHLNGLYEFALGESALSPRKPDPTAALRLAKECGVDPCRCAYVGDSAVDVQTARNAGMESIWVSWGFRSREEMGENLPALTFDSAEELKAFLLGE